MIRFFSFIILGCIALFGHIAFFVIATFVYTFYFKGYELFILALCVDALFGKTEFAFGYAYTTTVFILCATMSVLKPHLRVN